MRGRTLNDAFIILDEAQNTTPEQMKMFLTRLGFGSKIVVTGDVTQIDLPGSTRSGLQVVRDILDGIDDVHFSLPDQHGRRAAPAGERHRRRLRPVRRRERAGTPSTRRAAHRPAAGPHPRPPPLELAARCLRETAPATRGTRRLARERACELTGRHSSAANAADERSEEDA